MLSWITGPLQQDANRLHAEMLKCHFSAKFSADSYRAVFDITVLICLFDIRGSVLYSRLFCASHLGPLFRPVTDMRNTVLSYRLRSVLRVLFITTKQTRIGLMGGGWSRSWRLLGVAADELGVACCAESFGYLSNMSCSTATYGRRYV